MFNEYEDIMTVEDVMEVLHVGKNRFMSSYPNRSYPAFVWADLGRSRKKASSNMYERTQVCKNKKIPRSYTLLGYRSYHYFILHSLFS